MKKIVNRVTLTGPNQKTDLAELVSISQKYPFVEWGILLSKASMGSSPRSPNRTWMQELYDVKHDVFYGQLIPGGQLSGHLCGRWVRDVCKGEWTFLDDLGHIAEMFDRIQLNFHAEVHRLDRDKFIRGFTNGPGKRYAERNGLGRQFIFQMDDVNNDILDVAREAGINAVPLFDLSGGAGVLPENWPMGTADTPEVCHLRTCRNSLV